MTEIPFEPENMCDSFLQDASTAWSRSNSLLVLLSNNFRSSHFILITFLLYRALLASLYALKYVPWI